MKVELVQREPINEDGKWRFEINFGGRMTHVFPVLAAIELAHKIFSEAQKHNMLPLPYDNDRLRKQLVDAANEINVAGPVAHRIRILKENYAKESFHLHKLIHDIDVIVEQILVFEPMLRAKNDHVLNAALKEAREWHVSISRGDDDG